MTHRGVSRRSTTGRWVFVGGCWGWVPGPIAVRPVYAPTLVAFVGGRHFSLAIGIGGGGGVGWFPLGPREVYVPSYRVSPTYVQNVNTSNTTMNNTYVTSVYNNQTNIKNTNINDTDVRVSNIKYVNQNVPGAVTVVPQSAFASAQSVSTAAVHVDSKQIAAAQVNNTAAVVPARQSVLNGSASASVNNSMVAKPPATATERAVVTKTPPPPPPVPFDKQQHKLAAHPGRPLGRNEVENLRPTTTGAPAVHSIDRGVLTVDAKDDDKRSIDSFEHRQVWPDFQQCSGEYRKWSVRKSNLQSKLVDSSGDRTGRRA